MNTLSNIANTTLVSIVLVVVGYFVMERDWLVGPVVVLLALCPWQAHA